MSESELVATVEDVEASLLRELTDSETQFIDVLLDRSLSLITAVAGEPDTWSDVFRSRAVAVQAEMVARRLRNPEGYYSEGDGQYQYSRDRSVASGRLELTDADLEALGLADNGLQIWLPQYGAPTVAASGDGTETL